MIPLPSNLQMSLSETDNRQQKSSGQSDSNTKLGTGGGLRSSIVNNLSMGGSTLEANTGDAAAIPTWAYWAVGGVVAVIGYAIWKRKSRA